jgi:cell division cycle 20-like protein 1 (cofactor of APC complex)
MFRYLILIFLAVGTNLGELQLWDITKLQKIRTFGGHSSRIGSLA